MKRILLFLLLLPAFSFAQLCADEDTVRSNAVTLITYNSARVNGTTGHFSGTILSISLKYVRVGQTDTATSTSAGVNALRNITGLQASTEYIYYYISTCGSGTVKQSVVYTFTTLANTVNYTPMAAMGYQFKYLKADSGLMVPRRDTTIGRAPDYGGQIVWKPEDSTFYGYNGEYWHALAIDSAGIIAALNDKVDSVTVSGDSLWYWKLGVSYGYILPTQANEWKLLGNSGTTAGTNFVGTTDAQPLVFKFNSTESGRLSSSNTSFGLSSLIANAGGTENVAIGNESLVNLTTGAGNTAVGYRSLYSVETEDNHIGIGNFAGAYATTGGNELFINSIDRSGYSNDTLLSIIYGSQSAAGADQRLRLNSRLFADYLPSGVGDKSVRWNSTTKEFTYADTTTGSSTPTWQQTLTAGSTLTGDNTVQGGGFDFTLEDAKELRLTATGATSYIEHTANSGLGGSVSYLFVKPDSILIQPYLGNLHIDTLEYSAAADDSMMVWSRANGGAVGMRAIPSGGSGANTALSNLASVAINTSLLLGTSDAAALGSTTKQWSDLFLAEGGVINWDNGDVTMTQSGNNLTVDGGALIVTNAEQTPASFTSTFAGNMQVNWNSSTGNNVNFVFQDAGTARWYIGNNSATGSDRLHILNSSASEALTILQGLNIGVNQTAPTARLHIGAGLATASYAPLKFTTGTNNTTAEAGAMEYTTPQLFFTNGRAVRQEIFQGQQARVSTQYDNTTTTLGNVTGLTANVAASGTYRFEAKLYTTSDVAGGIKVAIGGTATATAIRYEGLTTDAGLTTQGRATALGTAVGAVTAVTAAYVVITGTITVANAGTITVQAAANAATGTTSVLTGSTFVITEML